MYVYAAVAAVLASSKSKIPLVNCPLKCVGARVSPNLGISRLCQNRCEFGFVAAFVVECRRTKRKRERER